MLHRHIASVWWPPVGQAKSSRWSGSRHRYVAVATGVGHRADAALPALQLITRPDLIEVICLAPGLDPAHIDVQIDQGVLSIHAERSPLLAAGEADAPRRVQLQERAIGPYRQRVSLPKDVDASAVRAEYRDGVLYLRVPRVTRAPVRIAVVAT